MKNIQLYALLGMSSFIFNAKTQATIWEEMDRHFQEMQHYMEQEFSNARNFSSIQQSTSPHFEPAFKKQDNTLIITLVPHNINSLQQAELDVEFLEHQPNQHTMRVRCTLPQPEQSATPDQSNQETHTYSSSYTFQTSSTYSQQSTQTITQDGATKIIQEYLLPEAVDAQHAEISQQGSSLEIRVPVLTNTVKKIHLTWNENQKDPHS